MRGERTINFEHKSPLDKEIIFLRRTLLSLDIQFWLQMTKLN